LGAAGPMTCLPARATAAACGVAVLPWPLAGLVLLLAASVAAWEGATAGPKQGGIEPGRQLVLGKRGAVCRTRRGAPLACPFAAGTTPRNVLVLCRFSRQPYGPWVRPARGQGVPAQYWRPPPTWQAPRHAKLRSTPNRHSPRRGPMRALSLGPAVGAAQITLPSFISTNRAPQGSLVMIYVEPKAGRAFLRAPLIARAPT
jgi:hypothetical protein